MSRLRRFCDQRGNYFFVIQYTCSKAPMSLCFPPGPHRFIPMHHRSLPIMIPYHPEIRAGESVKFVVKFTSSNTVTLELPLTFETVGTGKRHQLHISGHCTLPSINADPRNVFMRRVKHRAEGSIPPVSKRFVISRGEYEFGPLLTWKRAEKRRDWRPEVCISRRMPRLELKYGLCVVISQSTWSRREKLSYSLRRGASF